MNHIGHTMLRAFYVRCAGLEFIAMAPSAGIACIDAMALHGAHAATAKPVEVQP